MTAGLLIGFLLYVNNFYGPMRQLATVWSSFQLALAALDRISEVLALESDMPVVGRRAAESESVLEFRNVSLPISRRQGSSATTSRFEMEQGKAYALVGPTGGGKTTTASLMARLYDPTEGSVLLDGRDIRSVPPDERARKIGFILQEPFLFTGTVRDNIVYGNEEYADYSSAQLAERSGEGQSFEPACALLGRSGYEGHHQRQQHQPGPEAAHRLHARGAAEAGTADSGRGDGQHRYGDGTAPRRDSRTSCPPQTTRVIIAHRLNTIDNVDQIFFVNSGGVALAGSMEHAVDMLLHEKRAS